MAAALLAVGIITAPTMHAQSAVPKFEVVSIKPCTPGEVGGRGGATSPGTLREHCVTVAHLIRQAYVDYANGRQNAMSFLPIEGGPSWINSELYEIDAKAEGAPGFAMMRGPMLQALLEDRFQLKMHRDTKDVPVYALTVAKGGLKLQASKEGSCVPLDLSLPAPYPQWCGAPKRGDPGLHLIGATIPDLCRILSAPEISDRQVIDQTGLAGMFDIQLPGPGELRGGSGGRTRGTMDLAAPPMATDPSADSFDAIRAAVEKLGLNLHRTKGPDNSLVIEHVERPTGN